ncbi:hypothetical protein OOZ15_01120 [Galbibacter sp. EGI 63066]|uniref:hypothetical protein n=1 Tax=Galbibacter sp. EGI 63066 TaxID=2993559 RepID=UPI0022493731|nr:hypothetical protein [Galbibacter sp. EGI 63066]MCX2678531.1 hypothetical protein [Galbibacter sp. EGI 63066]
MRKVNKQKLKYYSLFVGIGLFIMVTIISVVNQEIIEDNLYDEGIKTSALVLNRDSYRRLSRTGSRLKYSLTLKYSDSTGKSYTKKLTVNNREYNNKIGDTIEILIHPNKPSEITLLNKSKYYGTEERVVTHKDLRDFYSNQNNGYILSKLNKISAEWYTKENDSSCFLNKARRSFIRLTKDSITYYGQVKYEREIKKQIQRLNLSEYGKFNPGYFTDIPFGEISEPKVHIDVTMTYAKYIDGNKQYTIYNQIDYSNRAWTILSMKTTTDKH